MIVRVEYTGQIRTAAGRNAVDIDVEENVTLGGLVAGLLATSPPGLRPHLLAHDGRLQSTLVVVIDGHGVGGTAAFYLAAADVGRLVLAHAGPVRPNDYNRQILMSTPDVGRPRVEAAAERLALNAAAASSTAGRHERGQPPQVP